MMILGMYLLNLTHMHGDMYAWTKVLLKSRAQVGPANKAEPASERHQRGAHVENSHHNIATPPSKNLALHPDHAQVHCELTPRGS